MNTIEFAQKVLPGIQLAIFELVWPVCDWLEAIYIDPEPGEMLVRLQDARAPSSAELGDCDALLKEIFEAVMATSGIRLRVALANRATAKEGSLLLMSPHIFRRIASEHAPWRLDIARKRRSSHPTLG